MKPALRADLTQKFTDISDTETDIRTLSSLIESIPDNAKEAAQLWREAVQRVEKNKKLSLLYVAHELITSTRAKTQVFIKAFGDEMLLAAESYCKGSFDIKKLEILQKLGEMWLKLKIYTDVFVTQLQSLVSSRKQQLSDSLNKIDTEVLDLLDECRKCKSEDICNSMLRGEATHAVQRAVESGVKGEELEGLDSALSQSVLSRMEAVCSLGKQMREAMEQMEEIKRDMEEAQSMREKLKEIESQEAFF